MHIRRTTMALLAAASLLFAACSAETDPQLTTTTGNVAVAAEASPADDAAGDTQPSEDTAPDAWFSAVTFEGQDYRFENYVCSSFGPALLSAGGIGTGDTPADYEFNLSWEQPTAGDGPDAEYNNTVSIVIDGETWTAGTRTGQFASETGTLSWERTDDVVTGTATVVSIWDASKTAQLSFTTNCT